MITHIKYITLVCCIFAGSGIFAQGGFQSQYEQNKEFIKDNFPKEQKAQFKEALKEIEMGDELMLLGKGRYKDALKHYMEANKFNPNSATLNYKIGKCYLIGHIYKIKSISYLEKAFRLNNNVDPEVHYLLGQAYQINSEWDKAIEEYNVFLRMASTGQSTRVSRTTVNKKIQECNYGKELVQKPVRVFIDNLGDVINSKYAEYGAIISADESVMIFTSRRANTTGGGIDPNINQFYEDLYVSYKVGGEWTVPKNMPTPINTDGHDAAVNLSPDGQKLLIYVDDKGDGNIYECTLQGETWSKPKRLYKTVNSPHHESSASYSFNGKYLYFVSNRPELEGGIGGRDIYRARWNDEKSRWGEAYNLGPTINTKLDEESIFMHPDGKTLYFSSQGHNSMGGHDIFKTLYENGKWSKPENLGYPINSPDDDVFFVLSGSGRNGYYSSFKTDGAGEKDIYKITFLGPEKPVQLNTEDNLLASLTAPVKETVIEPTVEISKVRLTILKGFFKDKETLDPIVAAIEIINNADGSIVSNFTSNSSTGKYLVSLPSGKNYGLAAKAEGYLFHSENFNIPLEAAFMEVHKDIFMKKIKVGETIVLRNIFFDYGKHTLRPESTYELERVLKIMVDNPTIKVEISGHTDNRGSDSFNQKLSGNRAKSVVDHLIGKGIPSARLIYAGYGETQPIDTNDTEEGRQLNRRTEFKILEK
ncbi:MAG: peptidoglycan-associated lipoprotein [Flavobacteriales bacterium]|nr:MAG: peptidoglycan-associated lipoprotein [Flavobacteriales bacterium]